MRQIKLFGIAIFLFALGVFLLSSFMSQHTLSADLITDQINNETHRKTLIENAEGILGKTFNTNVSFVTALKEVMANSKSELADTDTKLEDWQIKNYLFALTKYSSPGPLNGRSGLAFILSLILGSIGALIYFLPDLKLIPGIKNNHIYHSSATRGISKGIRWFMLVVVLLVILFYAITQSVLLTIGVLLTCAIIGFSIYKSEQSHNKVAARSAAPLKTGWIGLVTGIFLISFYVLLYFHPYYITNWVKMLDPVSMSLSGYPASHWFVYGFLYCVVMVVMGIRMLIKYRHNRYQLIRTLSVIFFQLAFAFIIPELLVRFEQPYMDLKNIWPLDYDFFTKDEMNKMIGQGSNFAIAGWSTSVGTVMFIWGIVLVLVVVPLLTYFFGKRWYCSWVCGCGGLAETLGDPYRQLSDKSLRAWKIERFVIHGVMVFAIVMTGVVLYQSISGNDQLLFLNAYSVKGWYGFMIGAMFSGVVGTGFYPIMGNRVWCRFGCPLTAMMGLIQKFKSRFRITVNGGQCISCGNCSTYCEMGIDVRAYAQRGQDIVRASCVGCGVCSAVCPRGVLKLENSSADVSERTSQLRTIHISENEVKLLS